MSLFYSCWCGDCEYVIYERTKTPVGEKHTNPLGTGDDPCGDETINESVSTYGGRKYYFKTVIECDD